MLSAGVDLEEAPLNVSLSISLLGHTHCWLQTAYSHSIETGTKGIFPSCD